MTSLESIIRDVASRFALGNKAELLVSELLALIIDNNNGGLTGFVGRLERAGMGELVNSWVKIGPNNAITEAEVERGLGSQVISDMASKVGLALHTTRSALAFLLPAVVDFLTPQGAIPTSIPAEVRSFIGSEERVRVNAAHQAAAHHVVPQKSSPLRWLLPLLALLVLGFFGFRYCNAPKTEVVTTPSASPIVAAKADSWLTLINEGGKLGFSGVVADEQTRQEILNKIKAAFGEGNYAGEIKIDPNVKPMTWLAKLGDILAALIPGAELSIEGNSVYVGGNIPNDRRMSLLDRLKALFGAGFNIKEGLLDIEAKIKESIASSLAALRALTSSSSADDVVRALNLHIIHFATGKADIPPANQEVLRESAKAIKNAKGFQRIEIDGYTDDVGGEAMNLKLSEARAQAVRDFLVKQGVSANALVAKGYGEANPEASNASPEGRFANRRIEYSLVK